MNRIPLAPRQCAHAPQPGHSRALQDLSADLARAGFPLPHPFSLSLPRSSDHCRQILAFIRQASECLAVHEPGDPLENLARITEHASLLLQHGTRRDALLGAIALTGHGVLPQNLPGEPSTHHWAHHLARHGFEPSGGFRDTRPESLMSLRERFQALIEAGFKMTPGPNSPAPLMIAIEADNVATLTAMLDLWREIGLPDALHDQLVHHAAEHDSLNALNALRARGYACATANETGGTPLHLAAANGSMQVLECLLEAAPAAVIQPDASGRSALHLAAMHGQTGVARRLLAAGASLYSADSDGRAPIHLAAHFGQEELVRLLCRRDPELALLPDRAGNTPMHLAAQAGGLPEMEALHRACPEQAAAAAALMVANRRGETPLHLAAQAGQLEASWWLSSIAPGLLNVIDNHIQTPIHLAAVAGHGALLRALLHHPQLDRAVGANSFESLLEATLNGGHIELATELVRTPGFDVNMAEILRATVSWCPPRLLTHLLQIPECNPNQRDENGNTPLHQAAILGRDSIVAALLGNERVEVTATTEEGATALHLAAGHGHTEVVRVLLKDGRIAADALDQERLTAADVAGLAGYEELQDLLHAHARAMAAQTPPRSASPPPSLPPPSPRLAPATHAPLRERAPSDINKPDGRGFTALHVAVKNQETATVAALLRDPGVQVNATTAAGNTALHLAAHQGATGLLRALLQSPDLDVNRPNRDHRTAIELAAARGHFDAVRLLALDARVAPARISRDGHDTRSLARAAGHADIAEWLSRLPAFGTRAPSLLRRVIDRLKNSAH